MAIAFSLLTWIKGYSTMENIISVVVVICLAVLAVGYAYMFNQPHAVRHPDGKVSIVCRAAPLKDFVRYTAIVVGCVVGAASFVALIAV